VSGPDPSVAAVRSAVRAGLNDIAAHQGPGFTGPVEVACSGGADSLALAAGLAFEGRKLGWTTGLITVDHGLQAGSLEQAQRVAEIGRELGLDLVRIVAVDVDPSAPGGVEAAARSARYAALDQAGAGAPVLLGHTLDDQAETVLLGLGRGSGPRSIAGMRARSGHLYRPLLGLRRSATVAACRALGLSPWDDPHNADPRFQRVRLRTEVLPLLEDVLQGGVAQALARTAGQLQADLDALADIAAGYPPTRDWPGPLEVTDIVALDPAIRVRVLRDWLRTGGVAPGELRAEHLSAVEQLVVAWRGQGPIQLPGGLQVSRSSGTLGLTAHA
jgi:tRNA(Ile)-lysidine synthase